MHSDDGDTDDDSLFGSEVSSHARSAADEDSSDHVPVATRTAPSIPGLFLCPDLLPRDLHDRVLHQVSACDYFAIPDESDAAPSQPTQKDGSYSRSSRNQAMLFARSLASTPDHDSSQVDDLAASCGLPTWSIELISQLQHLLSSTPDDSLPPSVKHLLFPPTQLLSRQLILNLYTPAEGLAPHTDLVHRFADGIILCSFGPHHTGTVMDFTHETKASQHLFLPSGSVLVLSGEARYEWKHGITARSFDRVQRVDGIGMEKVRRSIRLSVTIRSMLPGADVVGE